MKPELKEIALTSINPSKTNPRKDFASASAVAYLAEIAETIKLHGVKQPALVRPIYCVGTRSRGEIEKARGGSPGRYELVFGECRWRASKIAGNESLPCIVEEMTDDDAREVQTIENLQRRDLSPLEEAQGIEDMLALRNDDGTPRYTIETLAQRLGHETSWIYKRKELLKLPETARKALSDGVLTPKVARLIITVPAGRLREDFAAHVLKPEFTAGPLTWAAARDLRDAQFIKVLKGAPFPLDDSELVKEAGACAACPKMSANCTLAFDRDDTAHLKQRTCLDPVCYRAKIAALQKRQMVEAEKAGKKMLPADEAAKVYPFYTADGEMDPRSPYVQIGRKPADCLLKKEVSKVQTWEKLIEDAEAKTGANVPRFLIPDQKGVLREHVELKLAIAAIEKSGEPIFRDAHERAPKPGVDPAIQQRKAEAERAKTQWAVASASLDALWLALEKGWDTSAVWDALFSIAQGVAGDAGLSIIVKWRGLKVEDGDFAKADAVEKWWRSLKANQRDAVVPLLLVAAGMKQSGAGADDFIELASALKVDLGAVEKKAVAELKAKAKASKLPPAELDRKVREMVREKRTASEVATLLGVPVAKVEKIVAKIAKENAAAKLTNDPKTLGQWARAHASGMTVEAIAKSYGVPVADVEGALSSAKPPAKSTKPGAKRAQKGAAAK